ncbi:MAG: hypothetical protein Q7J31_06340, partial [Syntrophales bacterium]|nr:hypothetical protein [Syntrophales bacterium]
MDIMSINTSSEIIGNTSLEGRHYHMRATGGGTLFIPEFGTLYQSHRQRYRSRYPQDPVVAGGIAPILPGVVGQ